MLFALSYNTASNEKNDRIVLSINLTMYVRPLLVVDPTVNAIMEKKLESYF